MPDAVTFKVLVTLLKLLHLQTKLLVYHAQQYAPNGVPTGVYYPEDLFQWEKILHLGKKIQTIKIYHIYIYIYYSKIHRISHYNFLNLVYKNKLLARLY